MNPQIPNEILTRTPLMKKEWMSMLMKMRESAYAPRWNTQCGDRLTEKDLPFILSFQEKLYLERKNSNGQISDEIIHWISKLKNKVLWFRESLNISQWEKRFSEIRTMSRKDLQARLEAIVPVDLELSRLIVNPTSGTTGQPIPAPNHPAAIGCYDPMIQFILQRHGVKIEYSHEVMAAIQLCAQKSTITYNTVHSFLKGAGFAKINLNAADWKNEESPAKFVEEMAPVFFSGDPFAFYQAMKSGITYKPKAILSSAVTLEENFRNELQAFYSCPAINFYSLNETGPIAYSCPHHPNDLHILPTDLFVEALDEKGFPVREGEKGEITVTGGRNPFIPLLRYRTGDYGSLDYSTCSCGDPMPRIKNLEARKSVIFMNHQGKAVNPVDISRILKDYPIFQHQFIQKKNLDCVLRLYPSQMISDKTQFEIAKKLESLFGKGHQQDIRFDLNPFESKTIPFIKE